MGENFLFSNKQKNIFLSAVSAWDKFVALLMHEYPVIFGILILQTVMLMASLSLAVPYCEAEVKISGKASDVFLEAVASEDAGKTNDAIASYRLYLRKNKDVAPVYFYLGNMYWETGHRKKAIDTYKKAEQACPT